MTTAPNTTASGATELPEFPGHPEPQTMRWSALESEAIRRYGTDMFRAGRLAASAPVAPTQPETFQWPEMPPSKGQSPVLFEDGYAEGWARCNSDFRRAIQQATTQAAPVAPAPHPDLRAQVMEIITGVWDHDTKIDDATDDVLDLAAAPKAAPITVKDQV